MILKHKGVNLFCNLCDIHFRLKTIFKMALPEPTMMLYSRNFKQGKLHCIIYLLKKFDHFRKGAKGGKNVTINLNKV